MNSRRVRDGSMVEHLPLLQRTCVHIPAFFCNRFVAMSFQLHCFVLQAGCTLQPHTQELFGFVNGRHTPVNFKIPWLPQRLDTPKPSPAIPGPIGEVASGLPPEFLHDSLALSPTTLNLICLPPHHGHPLSVLLSLP